MSHHSESIGSRNWSAPWLGSQVVSQGCDPLEGVEDPLLGSLMQLLAGASSVSPYSNGISTAEPQDRTIGEMRGEKGGRRRGKCICRQQATEDAVLSLTLEVGNLELER